MDQLSKFERQEIHLAGLEAVITKRNETIRHLEAKLASEIEAAETSKAEARGYKQGWKDCAGQLMEHTRKTKMSLDELHKAGFKQYLAGDTK